MTSDASLVAVPFSESGVHVMGLRFAKANPNGSTKTGNQMLAKDPNYEDKFISEQSAGQWLPIEHDGLTARWLPSSAVQRLVVLGSEK